jgi:hypothetical protein
MRWKRVRLIVLWLLATGMAILWLSTSIMGPHRQVEEAITRFKANPSQPAAERLAQLLAERIPTKRQGKRILALVLCPTVATRGAYPVERIPTVSIEWPFRLDFSRRRDTYATLKSSVRLEGQTQPTDHAMRVAILGSGPLILRCGAQPLPAGTCKGQVRIDCTVTRFVPHAPVWRQFKSLLRGRRLAGGTLREAGSYKTNFEIPVEITVTERDNAEQVALVSNPELDTAVRQSFTCQNRGDCPFESPLNGHGEIIMLRWTNVPIAVAFEPVLRLPDGREVSQRTRHIPQVGRFHTRANHGGGLMTHCTQFELSWMPRVEGYHEATIVLKPDPNFAYEDPAIKAIWNGTLEFPIHYTIDPEPDAE